MSAITAMRIHDELPTNTKTTISALSLMQPTKKMIKTLKRKALENKKGLFTSKYNQLPDYNQIFISLMNLSTNLIKIQYPHPELDPRLKYNTIYFQPAHPFYSKSVLQLLSYALSSSLNNYYALLKDQKIIVAKLPEASKEKNEYICIQNKCDQFKKTIFLKQNKFSTVQQKNQTINFGQGSVKVQKVQKCIISSNSTLHQSCIPEIRDNISNNKILKTTQQSKQSLGPDQKQKIEHNSDQRLIGEAKLPKLGIRTQEKQLLREDLLMRQIMSFPVKQKPNGTFREIRSLHK